MTTPVEDPFATSWNNPALSPYLNPSNVLEYFFDLTNPFYDPECNNEVIRMQHLSSEQLLNMTGVEYYLDHWQENGLYIIRKQLRVSPNQVTPLAYYYIINGTVMQAPDLSRLYHARIHTATNALNKALQTFSDCARFNSTDGSYSWVDPDKINVSEEEVAREAATTRAAENRKNTASYYQISRVEALINDWTKHFPAPEPPITELESQPPNKNAPAMKQDTPQPPPTKKSKNE